MYAIKLAASGIAMAAGVSALVKRAIDYSVVKGDTVSGIAARNGTTVRNIVKMNPGLTDPNRIRPGQRLRIPVAQRPAAPSAPRTPAPAAPVAAKPVPRLTPGAKAPGQVPALQRMNSISANLHKKLNNPNLEAAMLANFNHETGGTFDYNQKEIGSGRGHGIPQYTGASLTAYKGWLAKNKLQDSANNQIDYFVDSYMPTRAGYKDHMAPGAAYTKEQYADWLHRSVFTPAHTIRSNPGYNPAMTLKRTLAHNDFMKNRIKQVNGVWEGVQL